MIDQRDADAGIGALGEPSRRQRMSRLRHLFSALTLVLVFGAGVGVERVVWDGGEGAGAASSLTDLPEFDTLVETWNVIQEYYVEAGEISDGELLYGASRGMVEALGDTGHSRFLDPEEAEQFEQATNGELIGIGVEIDFTSEYPLVVSPIDGSPADAAGIRSGDRIVEVDGQETRRLTLQEVGSRIRGAEGTDVTLTLQREGEDQSYTVTITRQHLTIEPVSWIMLPDGVAFVRLSQFSDGAAADLAAALEAAQAAGAESLLLDLRTNPGGLVSEAMNVVSQFVPAGTLVFQQQDADGNLTEMRTEIAGVSQDLPLAVLVDNWSASAAEIVADALRDAGRAELIGETTYGTGTVLLPFELGDGSVALIGTDQWLTADGDEIWRQGVDPDIEVTLPQGIWPTRPTDDRLRSLVLLGTVEDEQLLVAFDQLTGRQLAEQSR